jgi:hypothetical protein
MTERTGESDVDVNQGGEYGRNGVDSAVAALEAARWEYGRNRALLSLG